MKAKDYVKKYGKQLNSEDAMVREEAAKSLLFELLDEGTAVARVRNTEKGFCMGVIIMEQNAKWNAIAKQVGWLKKDGLKTAVYERV